MSDHVHLMNSIKIPGLCSAIS